MQPVFPVDTMFRVHIFAHRSNSQAPGPKSQTPNFRFLSARSPSFRPDSNPQALGSRSQAPSTSPRPNTFQLYSLSNCVRKGCTLHFALSFSTCNDPSTFTFIFTFQRWNENGSSTMICNATLRPWNLVSTTPPLSMQSANMNVRLGTTAMVSYWTPTGANAG